MFECIGAELLMKADGKSSRVVRLCEAGRCTGELSVPRIRVSSPPPLTFPTVLSPGIAL